MTASDSYTPHGVLRTLSMAEEVLRSQNHTFDANIMASAYETIVALLNHSDAMAQAARWSEDPVINDAVEGYVDYRNRGVCREEGGSEEAPWAYTKSDNPSSPNHYYYHGDFWRDDARDIQ